jgi:predicted esterase
MRLSPTVLYRSRTGGAACYNPNTASLDRFQAQPKSEISAREYATMTYRLGNPDGSKTAFPFKMPSISVRLPAAFIFICCAAPSVCASDLASEAQLLRKSYQSSATNKQREFFLYLPQGYEADEDKKWPVILFLHGGGERGDGVNDLDYVLRHGPLGEAWVQRRDLPFIIIGPQLPVFGMHNQVRLRAGIPKPARLTSGSPPRADENRTDQPKERLMVRVSDITPGGVDATNKRARKGMPGGWQLCEEDLLNMVDTTLRDYRADPKRVCLTGLSYGGFGTWYLATAHPNRWAAIAPICGGANPELATRLAEVQMPIWAFHGGRDKWVKHHWIYEMANALEKAGHRSVRFTVHEDLGHDSYTRVYAGADLYQWFLTHRLQ